MKIDDIRQAVYPLLVIPQNKPLFDGSTRKPAIVKQMIRAIIFDCFGVLISDALEVMIAELRDNQPEVAEQIVATVHLASRGEISRQESSENIAGLLGISVDAYVSRIKNGEVKNHELLDYILELRKTYKTGLLSNISIGGLATRFGPGELANYFNAVVASGEIGYAKPEAQAYEIVADRLGVRLDECIFIDDREDYCTGAKGVGMQAILYRSFSQMKPELDRLCSSGAGA